MIPKLLDKILKKLESLKASDWVRDGNRFEHSFSTKIRDYDIALYREDNGGSDPGFNYINYSPSTKTPTFTYVLAVSKDNGELAKYTYLPRDGKEYYVLNELLSEVSNMVEKYEELKERRLERKREKKAELKEKRERIERTKKLSKLEEILR